MEDESIEEILGQAYRDLYADSCGMAPTDENTKKAVEATIALCGEEKATATANWLATLTDEEFEIALCGLQEEEGDEHVEMTNGEDPQSPEFRQVMVPIEHHEVLDILFESGVP